ncbi:hypothetical protein [Kribbella pratensis]|uniref:Uncharacterized protein n=1 Tax=Kribbella pratensis TaxID=2512112 RepID=A0A4R8C319_9ACTN|nr:hypothetical protein [Kribbella pratensis]TDW66195.1 hypothetical protein EV653_6217 [Kribbella pratensis]
MSEPGLPEAVVREALEILLARFEAALIADEDVSTVIREMLDTAGHSVDPARWHAALADELQGYMQELWPEDDAEPPPMLLPCLSAVCDFVLAAPWPELAWVLLLRNDVEPVEPGQLITGMTALLALGEAVEAEVRAEALMTRAYAEQTNGNEERCIDDWVEAFGLSTEPQPRIECATQLAVALSERDELSDAAEWAWRAGILTETADPGHDVDIRTDVVGAQLAAADFLHRTAGGPIERIRTLIDRVLSRPAWWPEGVSGAGLHVIAAGIAIEQNDISRVLDHLGKARQYWDGADEDVQLEWHLIRGEAAVLAGDITSVEVMVRTAGPLVSRVGDDDQRRRFGVLYRWVSQSPGSPDDGTANDVVDVVNGLCRQISSGVIEPAQLQSIERAAEQCDPAEQGHVLVLLKTLEAMVLAALGRTEAAGRTVQRAFEMLDALRENSLGGYPRELGAMIEMAAAIVDFRLGQHDQAARRMEVIWRRGRVGGSLLMTVSAASAAAYVQLEALHRPQQAIEAAVVALTAAQEIRYARVDSGDRLAASRMSAMAHELAINAAATLGDPLLMAEVLEVARAQAMPHVTLEPSMVGGPLGLLPSMLAVMSVPAVVSTTPGPVESSPGVELSPPPLIVMPWGSVALASWLSYPLDVERRSGRLTLEPVASSMGFT